MIARRAFAPVLVAMAGLLGPVQAAEPLRILSGGALEPAVAAALRQWRASGGAEAGVTFATAPRIAARLAEGEKPDLVLAPAAMIDELSRSGRLAAPAVSLGAIGVGIALRADAPDPGIRDEASLRDALLAADSIVFNRASTGLYVEGLLVRMGLAGALEARVLRFPDGDAVLRRIAAGGGRDIGFAAITEILLFRDRGVRLLGPLPEAVQNRTRYAAGLLDATPEGQALLAFLDGAAARSAMAAAGVE